MKRAKIYLLIITFMFGVLFTIGNPALPLYTEQLSIREGMVGFYFASTGLGLFVFATLWGALGDIKDRNKILGIAFLGAAFGQILFGLSQNEYVMLFSSMVTGIFTAGVLVNIYSYVNDTYEERERDKTLSYVVSLCLLGGALSYILGGYLAELMAPNYDRVFLLQGVLILVVGLFIFIEDTDLIDIDHHLTRIHFWSNVRQVFNLPWVPIFTITLTFFVSFSFNNVRRFLDYYYLDIGYGAFDLGLLVFVVGIAGLLATVLITPFFLKRMHNFRFLQIQFLLAPIFLYLAFSLQNTVLSMYTFYVGYTMIMAMYEPTAISFISQNKAVSQGVLVGVRQSIAGLGMTIGFVIGGFVYEKNNLYVFYLAVIFYIIVFVGFSILVIIKNREVKEYRDNYKKEV